MDLQYFPSDEAANPPPRELLSKAIVQLNPEGFFTGMVTVDEDPMEPGVFLVPPGADPDIPAPTIQEGVKAAKWISGSWTYYSASDLLPEIPLDQQKGAFIILVDSHVDAIYQQVIGNRGPEYEMAEQEAITFLNAYAGIGEGDPEPPAGQSLIDWAAIKNWTVKQAAEDIQLQATAWRTFSLNTLRPGRLAAKGAARNAVTQTELGEIKTDFLTKVNTWRQSLGLPTF